MWLADSECGFLKRDGVLAGVALGYSVSEAHDEGFELMLDSLGVGTDRSLCGRDRLLVTAGSEYVSVKEASGKVLISFLPGASEDEASNILDDFSVRASTTGEGLMCWWDSGRFVMASEGAGGAFLLQLASALKQKGVCFGLADGSAFVQQNYPVFVLKGFVGDEWHKRLN